MIFKQLIDQESFTYTYLVGDESSREAVLIDPVQGHEENYLDLLKSNQLKLKFILDTHVHADHITAAGKLRELTGAESVLGYKTKSDCVSKKVRDGDSLLIGATKIQVIETPGHTPCHVAYLIGDRLFTGDALFIDGCGRTDFQGGSSVELYNSVVGKLFKLPNETLVYPGHDYKGRWVSSIAQEKQINPRFAGKSQDEFVKLMSELKLADPKKIHEAVPANEKCGLVN